MLFPHKSVLIVVLAILGLILGFFVGTLYANYRLVATLERAYGIAAYGPSPSEFYIYPSGDRGTAVIPVSGEPGGGRPVPAAPFDCSHTTTATGIIVDLLVGDCTREKQELAYNDCKVRANAAYSICKSGQGCGGWHYRMDLPPLS